MKAGLPQSMAMQHHTTFHRCTDHSQKTRAQWIGQGKARHPRNDKHSQHEIDGFDSFIILYNTAWKSTWSLVRTMLISPRHSSGLIACGLENPKVAYRMTVVGMQNVTSDTNNHKFSTFTKMTGQGRSNDVNHTTAMRLWHVFLVKMSW